jgi:uncharacterized protein (TIGR02266 family)
VGPPNLVRIRLRYADLDVFVEKFAPNVTRGGLFLASRNVHPVGALIDFEIQLVDGKVALAGRGKVTWVKEFDASQPNRPYGMGVQFVSVGSQSRAVLARLLRTKSGAVSTVRGLTGPHATLGASGPAAGGTGAAGGANGRAFGLPIDTSVDLAAELGVDDAAVRFALDRRRSIGARPDDDLADLLRRDPLEPATVAQAVAELPRLLDPQNSRRRGTAGFRVPELVASASLATPPPASARPVEEASTAFDSAERTNLTEPAPLSGEDDGGPGPRH